MTDRNRADKKAGSAQEKKERLAEALRLNLKKRKEAGLKPSRD